MTQQSLHTVCVVLTSSSYLQLYKMVHRPPTNEENFFSFYHFCLLILMEHTAAFSSSRMLTLEHQCDSNFGGKVFTQTKMSMSMLPYVVSPYFCDSLQKTGILHLHFPPLKCREKGLSFCGIRVLGSFGFRVAHRCCWVHQKDWRLQGCSEEIQGPEGPRCPLVGPQPGPY